MSGPSERRDWWIWGASRSRAKVVSRGRAFILWPSFSSDRLIERTGEHKFIRGRIYIQCYCCHVSQNVDRGGILPYSKLPLKDTSTHLELRISVTNFQTSCNHSKSIALGRRKHLKTGRFAKSPSHSENSNTCGSPFSGTFAGKEKGDCFVIFP